MERHFRHLIEWRGEHLACLQFRKMATWYCKALRTGKQIQQVLVLLDTPATFQRVVDGLRERAVPWLERVGRDRCARFGAGRADCPLVNFGFLANFVTNGARQFLMFSWLMVRGGGKLIQDRFRP